MMKEEENDDLYDQTTVDKPVDDDDQSQCLKCGTLLPSLKDIIQHMKTNCEHVLDNTNQALTPSPGVDMKVKVENDFMKTNSFYTELAEIPPTQATEHIQNTPTSTDMTHSCHPFPSTDIQLKLENDITWSSFCHNELPVIQPEQAKRDIHKIPTTSTHYCHVCHKIFTKLHELKTHIRTHNLQRPYSWLSCLECKKSFVASGGLERHLRTHAREHQYSCSESSKSFADSGKLKEHLKCHTGERPYICPECNKSFSDASGLRNHSRIHTGERPFSCPECSKVFSRAGDLTRHMRTHTGERPYSCSECDKSFTRAGDLKNHLRIHTGERPYSCPECSKSFARSGTLTKHLRIHTGERYSCSECDKSFSGAYDLKVHMRTHKG